MAEHHQNNEPVSGVGVMGKEGKVVVRGSHKGKGIAVFTSGGDSQGMY